MVISQAEIVLAKQEKKAARQRAKQARWRASNPDKQKANNAAFRERDPEYWRRNRERVLEYNRQYRLRNLHKERERGLRNKYRMTQAEWNVLFHKQWNCCAICKTTDPGVKGWQVDHDHSCCAPRSTGSVATCGKCVRSILCSQCNCGLGNFRDNPKLLAAAIVYLERHSNAS